MNHGGRFKRHLWTKKELSQNAQNDIIRTITVLILCKHDVICKLSRGRYLENAAADGHVPGEGALLVHVGAFPRRLGGLEPESDVLHEAHALVLQTRGEDRKGRDMRENPITTRSNRVELSAATPT